MTAKRIFIGILIIGIITMPISLSKKHINDPLPWSIGNDIINL